MPSFEAPSSSSALPLMNVPKRSSSSIGEEEETTIFLRQQQTEREAEVVEEDNVYYFEEEYFTDATFSDDDDESIEEESLDSHESDDEEEDEATSDDDCYSYYTEAYLSTIWEEESSDVLDFGDDDDDEEEEDRTCRNSDKDNNSSNHSHIDTAPSHPRRTRSLSPCSHSSLSPNFSKTKVTTDVWLEAIFGKRDEFESELQCDLKKLQSLGDSDETLTTFEDTGSSSSSSRSSSSGRNLRGEGSLKKQLGQNLNDSDNTLPTLEETCNSSSSSSSGRLGSFLERMNNSSRTLDRTCHVNGGGGGHDNQQQETKPLATLPRIAPSELDDDCTFVSSSSGTTDMSSVFSFASDGDNDNISLDVSLATYSDEPKYYIRKAQAEIDQEEKAPDSTLEKLQLLQADPSSEPTGDDGDIYIEDLYWKAASSTWEPLHTIPEADIEHSSHHMRTIMNSNSSTSTHSQRLHMIQKQRLNYEQSRLLLEKTLNLQHQHLLLSPKSSSSKSKGRYNNGRRNSYKNAIDLRMRMKLERYSGQRRHINYQRSKNQLIKKLNMINSKNNVIRTAHRAVAVGSDSDTVLRHPMQRADSDSNNSSSNEKRREAILERFGGLQRRNSFKTSKKLFEENLKKTSNELLSPIARRRSLVDQSQRQQQGQQQSRQRSLSPISTRRKKFLESKSKSESHLKFCRALLAEVQHGTDEKTEETEDEQQPTDAAVASITEQQKENCHDNEDNGEKAEEEEDETSPGIDTSPKGAMKRRHRVERYSGQRRRNAYERSKKALTKNMSKLNRNSHNNTLLMSSHDNDAAKKDRGATHKVSKEELRERFGGLQRMKSYRKSRELFEKTFVPTPTTKIGVH